MSTGFEIQRICQHCGIEFIAQKTVTKYCSLKCGQRAYKSRKRAERVQTSNNETQGFIIRHIEELKAKEFLSIADACKLLGISRRTVYRMIEKDNLKIAKAGTRTILRRSDIDKLFEQPKPLRVKKEPEPVTEFYGLKEIEEKYFVKYSQLNNIVKKNNIPKILYNGKLQISKKHIDRYFKRTRKDLSHISEWYTVIEIQKKYGFKPDQIYGRINDHNIPKQRIGKYVKISKKHFDQLIN